MLKVITFIFIIALVSFSGVLYAEEDIKCNTFGVSFFSGVQPGWGKIDLAYVNQDAEQIPTFTCGFAFTFGHINFIHPAKLNLSVEANYIRKESEPVELEFIIRESGN